MIMRFKSVTKKFMGGMSEKSQLAVTNMKKIIFQKSDAWNNTVVSLIMLVLCLVLILVYRSFEGEIQQYIAILKREILNEIFKLMDGIF